MKTKYVTSLLLGAASSILLLSSACQDGDPAPDTNTPNLRPLTAQEVKTVQSSNNFAYRSFTQISELEGNQNVFISPLSLSMALTMTYNGAATTTKEAIKETLGFENSTDEEINQSFKGLSELLTGIDKKVEFTSANSIWVNNNYQLLAPFVSTNQNHFDATVKAMDFSSAQTKNEINNWVKTKTNGKIPTIVDDITREHLLFLINAIYFKGTWTYPFKKELTQNRPFRLEGGGTVSHPFMTMNGGKYLLYQDATKRVIDLPYGNKQFSMTLIVPNEDHTVKEVTSQLSPANLGNWLSSADSSTLTLHMPKFKLSLKYKDNLKQALTNLGMGIAFTEKADFSRMLEKGSLSISEVNHKTFLEVNEEGTEAAAATSVGIVVTSLPQAITIDKPFIFLIRERSSNAILFIGKLMKPE